MIKKYDVFIVSNSHIGVQKGRLFFKFSKIKLKIKVKSYQVMMTLIVLIQPSLISLLPKEMHIPSEAHISIRSHNYLSLLKLVLFVLIALPCNQYP